MSKIIVDEIQTDTTNGNVRVIPNGTGALEVKGAGGDDAILQLNCSAQSHGVKLKSPAHSAGQSYTMILPDNQIAADKYLKVKSITGSGATAVGQLEYADVSGGGALELISKTTVSSAAANISISGLVQDAYYIIIGKKVTFSTSTKIELAFLDSSGSEITTSGYLSYYRTGASTLTASDNRLNTYAGGDTTGQQFYLRLNTTTNENGGYLKATSNGTNNFCNIHFQSGTVGLYGLYVRAQAGTINVGSEFLIYKVKES